MSMETPTANEAAPAEKRASGSSFYTAMRILPLAQRDAMFEIYSFCRAVDDVADSTGPREQRVRELAGWRNDIAAIYAGNPSPAQHGLAQAVQRFGLKREDFLAVIDGMEMDVVADIRAPDYPTLELYCDRVACAVGRLSVKVFGLPDGAGIALADQLGRALQLTNILRDLDEDAAMGRLYLPADALRDAGIITTEPLAAVADPRIEWACHSLVARARAHFGKAEQIMAHCPRRSVRAPRLMRAVYQTILERLVARGFGPPRTPIRIGKPLLVWMLLRYAII
jgi:presqualene diphosphate synthase